MARHVVYLRGEGPQALADARFLREGFSWRALGFGPFWLLAQGAWVSALIGLLLQAFLAFALFAFGLPAGFIQLGLLLVNLTIALESATIRGWELGLKGYRDVAILAGDDLDALEQRFYAETATADMRPAASAHLPARAGATPVLGLFPSPPHAGHGSGGYGS